MTNQEAIRILELMKNEMLLSFDHDRKEALKLAISALEKQIPMGPLPYEMGLDGKIIIPCGNCESTLDGDWDYCPYCGQNILWRVKGDTTRSASEKVK